jgi:REase_DpnII-MboI
VADAILSTAVERLKREVPQLPFGAVTTRPDFADLQDALFVEMKLVTSKASLRRVTTEVTSRIVIYRGQGAFPLFVIYDPKRMIQDDDAFRGDLEQTVGVWVAVAR